MSRLLAKKGSPWLGEAFNHVGFSFTAEVTNARVATIQLKNVRHRDIAQRAGCVCYISTDADGDNLVATAPSGGVATPGGGSGLIIPLVAGKAFQLVTDENGEVKLQITESGTASYYLVVIMPDGSISVSPVLAFA